MNANLHILLDRILFILISEYTSECKVVYFIMSKLCKSQPDEQPAVHLYI